MDALSAASLAGLSAISVALARRVRRLAGDLASLSERSKELSRRLDAAEQEISGAITRTETAERVLLAKGLADEEDLEAARRPFGEESAPGQLRMDEMH